MAGDLRVFSEIESLRAGFPGFVTWGETVRSRIVREPRARAGGAEARSGPAFPAGPGRGPADGPVFGGPPEDVEGFRSYSRKTLHDLPADAP